MKTRRFSFSLSTARQCRTLLRAAASVALVLGITACQVSEGDVASSVAQFPSPVLKPTVSYALPLLRPELSAAELLAWRESEFEGLKVTKVEKGGFPVPLLKSSTFFADASSLDNLISSIEFSKQKSVLKGNSSLDGVVDLEALPLPWLKPEREVTLLVGGDAPWFESKSPALGDVEVEVSSAALPLPLLKPVRQLSYVVADVVAPWVISSAPMKGEVESAVVSVDASAVAPSVVADLGLTDEISYIEKVIEKEKEYSSVSVALNARDAGAPLPVLKPEASRSLVYVEARSDIPWLLSSVDEVPPVKEVLLTGNEMLGADSVADVKPEDVVEGVWHAPDGVASAQEFSASDYKDITALLAKRSVLTSSMGQVSGVERDELIQSLSRKVSLLEREKEALRARLDGAVGN